MEVQAQTGQRFAGLATQHEPRPKAGVDEEGKKLGARPARDLLNPRDLRHVSGKGDEIQTTEEKEVFTWYRSDLHCGRAAPG